MTVHVTDIAAHILAESGGRLDRLKLQALTYYAQAWSLAWHGALFSEDFEAWKDGPVVRELWDTTHTYEVTSVPGDVGVVEASAKAMIRRVLDVYGAMDASHLTEMTHVESPWRDVRAGVAAHEPCDPVIPRASIAEYFRLAGGDVSDPTEQMRNAITFARARWLGNQMLTSHRKVFEVLGR